MFTTIKSLIIVIDKTLYFLNDAIINTPDDITIQEYIEYLEKAIHTLSVQKNELNRLSANGKLTGKYNTLIDTAIYQANQEINTYKGV